MTEQRPILIVPYMWIGDFVRCHSVVKILREREPERPVDILSSSLCAPLADYLPGLRKAIVADLPRGSLPVPQYRALGTRLGAEDYGQTLIMPRTWKSALAPWLAGIPQRTGFLGEMRFGLINDIRAGERELPRMIDRMCVLALPRGAQASRRWPPPEIRVPPEEVAAWRGRQGLAHDKRRTIALAPGAVGPGKAWPVAYYAQLAASLAAEGHAVWILGGPNETSLAAEIVKTGGNGVHDLTGDDLRDAIIALAAADAVVANDSGLMHIAAAIGTPTVAIFGPTRPALWGPLNPLAAALEPLGDAASHDIARRRTGDVSVERVLLSVRGALSQRTS